MKTKSFLLPIVLFMLHSHICTSQVTFRKIYGLAQSETLSKCIITFDNGYAMGGFTDVSGPAASYDYYLVRTDSLGQEQWAKRYGGSNFDKCQYVQQTTDSGFIIAGQGIYNFAVRNYLIKTDANGNTGCNDTLFVTTAYNISVAVTNSLFTNSLISLAVTPVVTTTTSGGYEVVKCIHIDVSNIENNQVAQVFPNPSIGMFKVEFSKVIDKGELQVMNVCGATVYKQVVNDASSVNISLPHIQPGIYFLQVNDNGNS